MSAVTAQVSTLLTLADSRLPTGGHVHSGGVEEAVEQGVVRDLPTVEAFLNRRLRTSGAVGASIAASVCAGLLDPTTADAETDARIPSPAARGASRAQGRGLLRLAKTTWPEHDWNGVARRPHLPVVAGLVGRVAGLSYRDIAAVQIYTTMTGSAIAAQRLLALDPSDVAACTLRLARTCDEVTDVVVSTHPELVDLSDPLLDVLSESHALRERPLFVS
ncbi:urease accessory protein UreF [Rhodococcus sp. BP-252]|uniref:Urease accessory protein UreF n=1 Tax=Rhodococcoides kyotonense TaxID=398843 RepID=A0A177Y728_9NOCA|nr:MULTISPECIES: urease accessory UreF family protein [Rhodococcus]MBY6410132.1 urease accessory protein UreF [Rhodococcus sp. BP-320]MBY6415101.1 urease accessory protein UreF [Rhodococcus sp. BP-321]MBY6421424.1 urease accessory protein UreF [Rhodococcus sp. BP-324]MBY6425591.1 urease accessory protein UreF [Rhodococcus sp. BP-323]MBY6429997.1 urease accessory protein UreF [Rhodococcus sp. BP-322]